METFCFGGASLLSENFTENAKQIFSSFKKFGKYTGFKQI